MNAASFAGAVRRQWRLFTAVVLACVVLAVGAALFRPARYVSTTQLLVSTTGASTAAAYENDDVVWGRVNSYIALLTSDVVNQRVVDALQLPESAKDMAAKVNATIVPPRTAVIDVAVSDTSPGRARQLADAVAHEFVGYTDALEAPTGADAQKVRTTVVSAAGPAHKSTPDTWVFALLGLAAGAVLGSVAVWIRYRTDPVVRSADRAAAVSGLPVVGEVVPDPATDEDTIGYRRLRARLRSSGGRSDESRLWLISGVGDSAAASGVASTLAQALATGGEDVLLIRTVPQGVDDAPGLVDVLTGSAGIDQSIHMYGEDRLHLLPAGSAADALELLVGADMRALVARLRGRYRHLVVDAGSVPSTPTAEALSEYADGVLLVVTTGSTTRRDLTGAVERLRAVDAPLIGMVTCEPPVTDPRHESLLPDATAPAQDVPNRLEV